MDNTDKTSRSIFVGNIPYEATEEKLMSLFSQAGPVIGFRLVYDRESGKPKGYGFCEYNCAEVARSALRNLNNIDFNGRPLRIGPAAGEQNNNETTTTTNTITKPVQESLYGEKCDPSDCCRIISQRISALPTELLRQSFIEFKEMVRDNPVEAKQMLLQNPQLAYGLVQAMIIMGMMDPKKAMSLMIPNPESVPDEILMRRFIDPLATVIQKSTNVSEDTVLAPKQEPNFVQTVTTPVVNTQLDDIPLPDPPSLPRENPEPVSIAAPVEEAPRGDEDEKKTKLIYEVLSLSDDQVAQLPEDQRNSIYVLRSQLTHTNFS